MFCKECGNEMHDNADVCVVCGVAVNHTNPNAKSKMVYILLGALLGLWVLPGIHNLYAGYTERGLVQLLLTILTCGLLWIPIYIWVIIEICTETHDADGIPFSN